MASLAAWSLDYGKITPKNVKLSAVPDAMIGYVDPRIMEKPDKNKSVGDKKIDTSAIQVAKAWEAAMAPAKSIPMNLMMMYMSGNGVQIFSMMVVFMTVINPLKGITTINTVFAPDWLAWHKALESLEFTAFRA
ncbi:hypothetical protein MVES1_000997 [Malassezia vespertilionis]|uniref:uncharacterized protein n=1 Tax=Malassezia vespertilionis TaxID=2020962 RepID=UPI0024B28551|nr:uncharacterized protein MVES1_000997 [Malassezia vespertilionis]WFD05665.1 hypothetical protein MVES1_000997 [Malassezia vespertilionis]